MRVALVHRDLHRVTRGGICTLYLALADELVRLGHEVVLITQDTPHPVVRAGLGW
jgi:D-inositol-3-phosphate glycosyltransferase